MFFPYYLLLFLLSSELIALKLSLLRKEHLPSAVDTLTKSPKILHISKRDC